MESRTNSSSVSELRRYLAFVIIYGATAQSLGHTFNMATLQGGNDISRWCTVWSLVEQCTYAIDDCPWQSMTQDKVYRNVPFQQAAPDHPPAKRFYSSKPPLLPTLVAGMIYPWRWIFHWPVDATLKGTTKSWLVHVYYFKPIVILLNIIPFFFFLAYFKAFLDRFCLDDWSWMISLTAAAWGTPLFVFNSVLNNHTIAAYSGFFSIYAALAILADNKSSPSRYIAAGFFGALCACMELPAAFFGVLLFLALLYMNPRMTLCWFAPAASIPCAAFLVTQYMATGTFIPVYSEFGTESYLYPGSYWLAPGDLDAMDEPKWEYLYHMVLGHHGILSLSPIFLFSAVGIGRLWRGSLPFKLLAGLTTVLTVATLVFYVVKTNNYGGTTQGLRWLFWLIPFWLLALPFGLESVRNDPPLRWCAQAALLMSIFSVGYALTRPWSHPWLLELLERTGLYEVP